MVSRFVVTIIVSAFVIFSRSLFAQECGVVENIYEIGGFTLAGKKVSVLSQNRFTELSLQLGEQKVVDKITKFITSVNPRPRGSESPRALAQNIYDVSKSYGVDPILMAAKIRQESGSFNVDVVARGGDTGLTQMTGDELDEIKEQYVKINSRNRAERQVGNVLVQLSQNYFKNSKATNEWLHWAIKMNNTQKKRVLVQSADYALAAGASLLKIYLAAYNGDYRRAISQFNGGGVKNYYGKVNNHAEVLRKISQTCGLSDEENESLQIMCEIAETEEGCRSLIQEILPTTVKQEIIL